MKSQNEFQALRIQKELELKANPITTKKKLFAKYWKLPKNLFRQTINKIISEVRGIDLNTARKIRTITPKEYVLFVDEIEGL